MDSSARKIAIHIRNPKKQSETHTHKKVRAHLHVHSHDHVRNIALIETPRKEGTPKVAQPGLGHAEALVPSKLVVPKKPIVLEGISMSALSIAYFCMELGIESDIPTYSGGLGVLAGDTLRSSADLGLPVIGVSLCYREGYFRQYFDQSGWQIEENDPWNISERLTSPQAEVKVDIEGREVRVRAWLYKMKGVKGNQNPIILLDTDVEGNSPEDRAITSKLYFGDRRARLKQEIVLGIGGVRMLTKLGATNIQKFHMNEGHSALLTLELYRVYASCDDPVDEVRRRSVFTTHTPVAAGHDKFDQDLAASVIGDEMVPRAIAHMVFSDGMLNMTTLGFQFSQHINGVAKKHGEVTRELFPGYQVESITNGVHVREWVAPSFARLFDKYIPGWQVDSYNLRYALCIPKEELWIAHQEAKKALSEYVATAEGVRLNPDMFTIGFARRATAYKRGNMLFADLARLLRIADRSKGIQIVFAGKAHPDDHEGKLLMQQIIANMKEIGHRITCVYIPNYDMALAKLIIPGVDLWLNTPTRPLEASGTSGMKAALNGVPHFSTLDGWWLEGHVENVTGWSIGPHPEKGAASDPDKEDVEDLYTKLEYVILPKFENERDQWLRTMRSAIAINGSFFNTHRMVEQYVLGTYFL